MENSYAFTDIYQFNGHTVTCQVWHYRKEPGSHRAHFDEESYQPIHNVVVEGQPYAGDYLIVDNDPLKPVISKVSVDGHPPATIYANFHMDEDCVVPASDDDMKVIEDLSRWYEDTYPECYPWYLHIN